MILDMLVAFALLLGQPTQECPSNLIATGYGTSPKAQAYADCMSRPSLPMSAELGARKLRCAVAPDPSIARAVNWVDTIAENNPGCETRLEFKRK